MVRGISSGARVFEYLALKPTIPLSGGGHIPYHSLTGRVDFMNISFRLFHNKIRLLDSLTYQFIVCTSQNCLSADFLFCVV